MRQLLLLILLHIFYYRVYSEAICFPERFMFGAATAAYQVEGAWNVADKGESIWDHYTHAHPERISDRTNGDVADDSYHQFKEDVRILKAMGLQYYRFSISWSRVLPSGFSNKVSSDGVRYYNALIDELIVNNIEPLVTMYHFDLPQSLQDIGGWTNPIIADYFVDYAKVLFETFGDRVKSWITFNEPVSFCRGGYGDGLDAPAVNSSGIGDYMCGHNMLRAHGMVYRLYHKEFSNKQQGIVIITLDFSWFEAKTNSTRDREAAERARQFQLGWFANPILSKSGDYPGIMRKRIDQKSKEQHYPRSRLPHFTKEEIAMIRGSYDFLGVNSYTTYLVTDADNKTDENASMVNDIGVLISQDPTWPGSNSSWLRDVPWGFRKALNYIKDTYDNPEVIITENGVSTFPGLADHARVQYIDGYLRNLHAAITQDGCNIRGYTYWSLLDNFEWLSGLSERFGLFEVDYTSPERKRSPRHSAAFFASVAKTKCLPQDGELYRSMIKLIQKLVSDNKLNK